jgi:hypothetical protein
VRHILLERDAKKWEPVFCKVARPLNNLAQNADPDYLHFALIALSPL